MTDKEKLALKEAFGFEEPDRKDAFALEFVKLESTKKKRSILPIAVKFAAAAAMMAAVIGTALSFPKNIHDLDSISEDHTITEPAVTTQTVSTVTTDIVTHIKTTSAAVASKTTSTTASAVSNTTAASATTTKTSVTSKTTVSVSGNNKSTSTAAASHSSSTTTARPAVIISTTTAAADVIGEEDGTDQSSGGSSVMPVSRDRTVYVENVYPLRGRIVDEEDFINKSPEPQKPVAGTPATDTKDQDGGAKNIDISEMYENSCAVVLANLDEIVYTSIGGEAYTAETITVQRVYAGDIMTGDRVTLFFRGGYLPAEEYKSLYGFFPLSDEEEYSVRIVRDCTGKQNEGQQYVFFLKQSDYPLPHGAFEPAYNGDSSVFELGNGVCTSVGSDKNSFTISRVENGS